MTIEKIKDEDRLMATCAYLFFAPVLFTILTNKRRKVFNAYHSAQSLLLWLAFALLFIVLRLMYTILSGIWYFSIYDTIIKLIHAAMWAYAAYCGYLAFNKKEVNIPIISELSKQIL